MSNRLDKVLEVLQTHRRQMTEAEQDAMAETIETAFGGQDTIDPLSVMTPEELAELDRRLKAPVDPVAPEKINAIFAKHGIQSNF